MRGKAPTPNLGLKRKVASRFLVYDFDEFRTSCLYHETEEYCNNLYSTDKDGIKRQVHSILTFKMEDNRIGCIHRDLNSVLNIRKIVAGYLNKNIRLPNFTRGRNVDPTLCTVGCDDSFLANEKAGIDTEISHVRSNLYKKLILA